MNKIEKIKHNGEVDALKGHLGQLEHELTSKLWNSMIGPEGRFMKMQTTLINARRILDEMEETFSALKEIDPGHK